LDEAAALARLDELGARIEAATGRKQSREALASACLAIAASNMAQPIRKVSIARGFDVREHALVAFGGAGAQHACALADELGVTRVIVPEFASFLSAQGIGNADVRAFAVADLGASLDGTASVAVTEAFARLERDARAELAKEPSTARWTTAVRRRLDVRYAGQDSVLTIDEPVGGDWQAAFAAAHRQRFGFTFDGRRVEARAARVEAVATPPTARPAAASSAAGSSPPGVAAPSPQSTAKVFADGAWRTAAVHGRDDLPLDTAVAGPALVVEAATVLVVEAGWSVVRRAPGYLEVYRDAPRRAVAPDERAAAGSAADPMTLTLFVNRFTAIAEEMGTTLMRTALSVNVKERLDFSCAIFGPDGSLVVNAPHIPVHLGSMGDTVRALLRDLGASMRPGDVYVTNDPYRGGSHLPDVTAVTPVFDETGRRLLFFTGSRAHHAEIGGTAPGSMPPDATSLAEEGVLLRCVRWRYGEEGADEELRRLFSGSKWPSRSVETNIADLRAQAAANALGRERLSRLVETFGLGTVTAYMRHIREASTTRLRTALAKLAPGQKTCRDQMDDGTPVVVTLTPTRDAEGARLTVDFTGTGAVAKGNLNANLAIVKAATLYALRCLIAEDVPLNEGVLGPVDFVVPFPSLLSPPQGDDPTRLAAVNAGNVETSQRLVDVLLGALGLAAASQGTMNNLLFGRAPAGGAPGFGYYETICGGAGAGPGFAGASGVHTHMTNTRITDPEVLEERFPVRLRRFALRHGSGGAGKWRGGDGVVRELEFLAPVELSLITSRRATAPWGLQGGSAGAPGKNVLVRRDGSTTVLPPMARAHVEAGDALTLETPGGGGFGKP
jgi:5-oxoprolinase (ATP-hydrolysing)